MAALVQTVLATGYAFFDYGQKATRSLKHPRLHWYFGGVLVSLLGTFLQLTLLRWAAFSFHDSATTLGLLSFCCLIPNAVLAMPAGLLVARRNKRDVLLYTQLASAIPAALLAYLAMENKLDETSLLLVSFALGCIMPFETAARFPLMAECVEGEAPTNAFSLSALVFYISRCLGPLLGGLLLGFFSVSTGFLINFASYLVEIATLLLMGRGKMPAVGRPPNFADVWRFCVRLENADLLAAVVVVSFLGVQLQLMPVLSSHLYSAGSLGFGFLLASNEVGAVASALWLATRQDSFDQTKIVNSAVSLMAVGLLVFCFCGWLPLGLLSIFAVGLGQGLLITACQNVLQGRAPQPLRAPLASIFWAVFFCCQGIGAIVLSTAADYWDIRSVFVAAALLLLALAQVRKAAWRTC